MPPAFLASGQFQSGFAILLEAADAAHDATPERWDFAVELPVVVTAGLSHTHLRWLILKGYALHGIERPARGKARRSVHRVKLLRFRRASCFILTDAGMKLARSVCKALTRPTSLIPAIGGTQLPATAGPHPEIPQWNADSRKLLFHGKVVLLLKRAAPNLRAILDAFEAIGWARIATVTLVRDGDSNPKTRLHNAINALNRHQRVPRIHFCGDGSGFGVEWHPIAGRVQRTSTTAKARRANGVPKPRLRRRSQPTRTKGNEK